jgi:hypothetical protein
MDEGDRGRGALDIEEQSAAREVDHGPEKSITGLKSRSRAQDLDHACDDGAMYRGPQQTAVY